jgi:hypothetical protein
VDGPCRCRHTRCPSVGRAGPSLWHDGTVNRKSGSPTTTEIAAAFASTGIATVATFIRWGGALVPTIGTFIFTALGFSGLAIWRELSNQRNPRAQARLFMACVALAVAAAIFLFYPTLS